MNKTISRGDLSISLSTTHVTYPWVSVQLGWFTHRQFSLNGQACAPEPVYRGIGKGCSIRPAQDAWRCQRWYVERRCNGGKGWVRLEIMSNLEEAKWPGLSLERKMVETAFHRPVIGAALLAVLFASTAYVQRAI